MKEILELIALTVIWCLMIKIVTTEGMLLERLGKYAAYQVEQGYSIFEALVTCEFCLPSIHTFFGFLIGFDLGIVELKWVLIVDYIVVASASSFLVGSTWNILQIVWGNLELIKKKTAYYDKKEQLAHFDISDRKAEYAKRNGIKKSVENY